MTKGRSLTSRRFELFYFVMTGRLVETAFRSELPTTPQAPAAAVGGGESGNDDLPLTQISTLEDNTTTTPPVKTKITSHESSAQKNAAAEGADSGGAGKQKGGLVGSSGEVKVSQETDV
jgi:hypothetical protein